MVTANVTLKYLKRSLAPINAKRVLAPIFFVMNSLINKTTPYLWKNELHRYKFYHVSGNYAEMPY